VATQRENGPADRPARGTRPRNRRELIVNAAADLFYSRGFGSVSMSDVAEAVAIGPSALYRHFAGKDELLTSVVESALAQADTATRSADPSVDPAELLAGLTLTYRQAGVLRRREARHLSDNERKRLNALTSRFRGSLAARIAAVRPELSSAQARLVTRYAMAVADSVSYHSLSIPEPRFSRLLSELIAIAVNVDVAADTEFQGVSPAASVTTPSRREEILSAAAPLFAERGFTGTSLDDVGAKVGIAGPSIYNHFSSKAEILLAVMVRGAEWLRLQFTQAVAGAPDPAAALARVMVSYQAFTFANPAIVEVMLAETPHLPEDDRERVRRTQHEYINDWVKLLRQINPAWTTAEARIRVQASQMLINDFATAPRFRMRVEVHAMVADIASAVLGVPLPVRTSRRRRGF
jgi:AcrR family transcriptional regulator